jgi:ABC-type transporter Mla MlaB component
VKVYVLGAGVSKTANYPLGGELFNEIDLFIRQSGPCVDRFDYTKDWPSVCDWMRSNSNPVIAEAYRTRQLEYMFTALDLATMLHRDSFAEVYRAMKRKVGEAARAEEAHRAYDEATKDYERHRSVLLWALEQYFEYKHDADAQSDKRWDDLKSFGRKLCPGDVVITFNYDATLERVLHTQGKWSPQDGYGFELAFQKSRHDATKVTFSRSLVEVLHLHGASGWYTKPVFRDGYPLPNAGAVPREALTPAPFETPISLDPIFLRDLGISAVDASMPERPPREYQLLIHPSYLKDYESAGESTGNEAFADLWTKAAQALRAASEIYVIGYSLPRADTAALTLLLTNCERARVRIVNCDVSANYRLRNLLSADFMGQPQGFHEWLIGMPDRSRW